MADQDSAREPISVPTVLMTMLDQMAAISWIKLGLQPDVVTGKLEPVDIEQAKLAFDVTAYIASSLEASLDESDQRQLHNLVRDLRLNYVSKQKELA
jgi:hypothetical protein